ncbi:hypothetical protein IMSAGC003_02994 [Lachnospiraceae bacterium]|jgi:hypothetical protein|nr:hypothetical protein [Lachnospiraceae bacterium]MCX4272323.1 hypothetical protein [Acetatifactor sp.]GFH96438.1 hypothetical protein IMSAGC003_02994 [Lachnospiraceae bacterium]
MRSNRFEPNPLGFLPRLISLLPLLTGVLILLLFLGGVQSVSDTTAAKQLESLETALSRSIAQCYSVEGMYPPSLKYLEEHYGLTYDRGRFLIDYQSVGANLMPEVTILSIQ